ncbi:hypothetical protein HYW67_03385 [Candidatus Parcubacteria bacterium]|nr:hypothetical protein [Candidatus Parcubacteria bacterium]
MRIVKISIKRQTLSEIAAEGFGDMVKAVVDVEQRIMAVGGELHADEETWLMEKEGSKREHTWGINLYPGKSGEDWIEFDSMINIKPAFGNRSRGVENKAVQGKIKEIVNALIVD